MGLLNTLESRSVGGGRSGSPMAHRDEVLALSGDVGLNDLSLSDWWDRTTLGTHR
jgi:hypothetical protein